MVRVERFEQRLALSSLAPLLKDGVEGLAELLLSKVAVTVQVEELAQRPQACWRQRQVLGEPRVAELRRYPAADRAAVDGGR